MLALRHWVMRRSSPPNHVRGFAPILRGHGGGMVSRRDMIRAVAGTGAAALHRRIAALLDAGVQAGPTPVNFRVPAGACDCHVHVFGDPRRFPFSPDRPYTPPPPPAEELRRRLRGLQMDRVVVVSPAVYGTNNDCALDAIRRL